MEYLTEEVAEKYLGKYIRTLDNNSTAYMQVCRIDEMMAYGPWIMVYESGTMCCCEDTTGNWHLDGHEVVLGEITKDQFNLLIQLVKSQRITL